MVSACVEAGVDRVTTSTVSCERSCGRVRRIAEFGQSFVVVGLSVRGISSASFLGRSTGGSRRHSSKGIGVRGRVTDAFRDVFLCRARRRWNRAAF
jgi:hypothetical protein